MDAARIKPGRVYAIRHPDAHAGELTRFTVTKIVTTSVRADERAKHAHVVHGFIVGAVSREEIYFGPDRILGPYEDYVDLVAKKEAEDKAKAEQAQARTNTSLELRERLYRLIGETPPEPTSRYGGSRKYGGEIEVSYSDKIEIDSSAVPKLLEVLRLLQRDAA